jgi:hypothetical protein
MKATLTKVSGKTMSVYFVTLILILGLSSCHKFDDIFNHQPGKGDKPNSYSSEVIRKWAALQVRLMKNATGVPNHAFGRHYAYSGVAAWESIAPGMPGYAQLKSEWNGLTGLPQAGNKKFYWPANANAALAAINRAFFPNASAEDKQAIDSLENAFNNQFASKASATVLSNSREFGKAVAAAVFAWSETDGSKTVYPPYVPPVGDGLWKPTAEGQTAATPYWGLNRTVVKGSNNGTGLPAPPAYSTQPGSAFHNMVKHLYDAAKAPTIEQRAMAFFWRDVPGATTPGHWVNILVQILEKKNVSLAKAAVAYALTGAAINDAAIAVMKVKYQYNLVRPITYVHEVMGQTDFNPIIGTPAHPEYPSAHSSLSMAVAQVLEGLFGKNQAFTDHTYDYLGYAPRTFPTYSAIATEAGQSRLYAGIHYQFSIDKGLQQGKKVASNILDRCNVAGY